MGYTRAWIISQCEDAFKKIKSFYQKPLVNYRGKTEDTDEYYTEVIAEFLCNNISAYIGGMPVITRQYSYKTTSHDGKVHNPDSGRDEENIAKKMYGNQYSCVGEMIDYQTPLNSNDDDHAGKIDLLAYDGKTLRILELKKPDSDETMLRCVLEAFTYWKTVDRAKLLVDFGLPVNLPVKACPFVFKTGKQHDEMGEERPQLRRLMGLLDSKPFYISKDNDNYTVTED